MNLKILFTWWNRQTFGTFLKTLFSGKYVGQDDFGNKYYKNNRDDRWVIYSKNIESTSITSDWYMWMHHTVDKVPNKIEKKYIWQKKSSRKQNRFQRKLQTNKNKKKQQIKKI